MKKALTIMVGLLAAGSLFAVIAAASDGETTADTRASATAATVADRPAEPVDDSDGDGRGQQGPDRDRRAEGLGRLAAKLASEGLISEDQVPAIEAWFESQGAGLEDRFDGPADVLAALVSDGVITQDQADDIVELMSRYERHDRGEHLGVLLKALASEGLISEDQIPDVKAWFESQGAGLEDRFDGPADVLAALVSDGVITQDQADDIVELMSRREAAEAAGSGPDLD